MIETLLILITILLAAILYQVHRQIAFIDAFAERVGEAIDSLRAERIE